MFMPIEKSFGLMDPFFTFPEFKNFPSDNAADAILNADILDKGDALVVSVDLPGFKKEDIKIDLSERQLTVSVERNYANDDKFLRRERFYGKASRTFNVVGIKTEDISASYTDGVLVLTMPKKQKDENRFRTLEIQ